MTQGVQTTVPPRSGTYPVRFSPEEFERARLGVLHDSALRRRFADATPGDAGILVVLTGRQRGVLAMTGLLPGRPDPAR